MVVAIIFTVISIIMTIDIYSYNYYYDDFYYRL